MPGWSMLSGLVEQRFDQQVLDLARHRHRFAMGRVSDDYVAIPPEVTVMKAGFVAHRDPWGLALIDVEPDSATPVVVWADEAWAALDGDPLGVVGDVPRGGRGPAASWGDRCVRALLVADWFRSLVDGPVPAVFTVEASALLAVSGEERGELAGCLVSLGTDPHHVEFNVDLGVHHVLELHRRRGAGPAGPALPAARTVVRRRACR